MNVLWKWNLFLVRMNWCGLEPVRNIILLMEDYAWPQLTSIQLELGTKSGILKFHPKYNFFFGKWNTKFYLLKNFFTKDWVLRSKMSTVFYVVRKRESHEHLLWSCKSSQKVWSMIFDWWGLSSKFSEQQHGNWWSWLNWFSTSKVKSSWGIAIVVSLWSLWLCRNRGVFERKIYKEEEILFLIKLRAFKWCEISNLVQEENKTLWAVNPEGAILHAHKNQTLSLFEEAYDIYGFSDGSFKVNENGGITAGIGGFFKR